MVENYGVKPFNPPDAPLVFHLQHLGYMYVGNPCFHPAGTKTTGEILSAIYPDLAKYFWRYYVAPRNIAIYSAEEAAPYAKLKLSVCALNRIVLASKIVTNPSIAMPISFVAYKFMLTHVIHLINPINPPQERGYWDIGLLPAIPLQYTWLLTKNGDDKYNGIPIESCGMYGKLINCLFNKILRIAWISRECPEMCVKFIAQYPHMWFYFVDMMLLCTFLGVYYPHDFYVRPFYLSLPVATVVCLWMRRIAYHYSEQWLMKYHDILMFAACLYLYDQVDHTTSLRNVMNQHFGHYEYMSTLKRYANNVRTLIEETLAPHAINMILHWNKPTREICIVWNTLMDKMVALIKTWYNVTMSPKCTPTPNYFSMCAEVFTQFLPKGYFYHIPQPIHECIMECAIITAEQCLTIPMFQFFFAFQFDAQFLDTITTILQKCIEDHDSIPELLSKFRKFIAPYPIQLSILIEYCYLCVKLCAIRAIPTSSHLRTAQRTALENRARTMIELPAIANVLFCNGCFNVKVSVADSNPPNNGPFRNLKDINIHLLRVPSSRPLENPSDRIGPPKNKSMIYSLTMQAPVCSVKSHVPTDSMRRYLHESRPLSTIDLSTCFVFFDRWIGMCAACGCNAAVHDRNCKNGYFYCDNHINTNVQFAMEAYINNPLKNYKPHCICSWGVCYEKPTDRSNIILNQFGEFIYFPLCIFHAQHSKLTSIICDFETLQKQEIEKSASNTHMSTIQYHKKITSVNLAQKSLQVLE